MKLSLIATITLALLASSKLSGQALTSIESVEYDSVNNRYLISNKTNIIAQSATDGSLSVFGQGAVAEFGMETMQGALYAVVGKGVKGYDLTTGKEVMTASITGAQMLNGMASDGDSLLWVTDTFGKSITQINVKNKQSPVVQKIVATTPGQPNGIYFDKGGNRLVIINWGNNVQVHTVDLSAATKTAVSVKTTDRNNCDGITRDQAGNWYIACWLPAPGVFKIAPDFSGALTPMTGTFAEPADMDYNPVANVIAVPNTTSKTIGLIQLGNGVGLKDARRRRPERVAAELGLTKGFSWRGFQGNAASPKAYTLDGQALPVFSTGR
jgi:hypothetical protein